MSADRSRLVAAALGAIALAVSVFLPWYGVSFTANGIALAEQVGDQVASQFGNASLQASMTGLHANLNSLAGHQFAAVSAHQVLKDLNLVLLALAGLALLDALVPLARSVSPLPEGAGASLLLLGSVATVCVIYRMVVPPTPPGDVVELSLREGAWLALLGSLTIVGAGLAPMFSRRQQPTIDAPPENVWSALSGWTPEA